MCYCCNPLPSSPTNRVSFQFYRDPKRKESKGKQRQPSCRFLSLPSSPFPIRITQFDCELSQLADTSDAQTYTIHYKTSCCFSRFLQLKTKRKANPVISPETKSHTVPVKVVKWISPYIHPSMSCMIFERWMKVQKKDEEKEFLSVRCHSDVYVGSSCLLA